ncbi:X-ray radiation resistance-associated protein 1 [Theristicus caerulescens]
MAAGRRGGEAEAIAVAVRDPLRERGRASGWGGSRPAGNVAVKMATTGLYKIGDGSNYATNCFPARNILRASKEGDTSLRVAGEVSLQNNVVSIGAGPASPLLLGQIEGTFSCGFLYQQHSHTSVFPHRGDFKMMDFSVGLKHQAECSCSEKGASGGLCAHLAVSSALVQRRARVWALGRRATLRAWTEKGTTGKTPQRRRKPPESASMEENNKDDVLDEPFLVSADSLCLVLGLRPQDTTYRIAVGLTIGVCFYFQHHCLKNPSDLCSVNISSQNLVSAKEGDFEKLDCVAFINAAENLLTLEPFRKFPGLRELELSLNGLRNLKITAGDFLRLEDLDLSYNNLSPQDIWTLGDLSQLKVLRLTANGFQSLPPDLAGSWDSAHLRFPSLEVLALDDNRLSDPSVFVSLSHLCSLRELNLDRNGISAVPYLHQAESRQLSLHPALDGGSFRAEWYKSLSSLWQRPRLPQQEDTKVPAELEAKKGQLEYVVLQNERDPGRTEVVFNSGSQEHPALVVPREGEPSASKTLLAPSTRRDVRAPFPALKHLSLAFNKVIWVLWLRRSEPSHHSAPRPGLFQPLQKKKSSPEVYREARRLMEELREVFEIPAATAGEERAGTSDEAQVVKALLAEATSRQGSPEQPRLPGKREAKKLPKV